MIVKIGNRLINSADEPVMIIFDEEEKRMISDMGDQTAFCSFPPGIAEEQVSKFMEISDMPSVCNFSPNSGEPFSLYTYNGDSKDEAERIYTEMAALKESGGNILLLPNLEFLASITNATIATIDTTEADATKTFLVSIEGTIV